MDPLKARTTHETNGGKGFQTQHPYRLRISQLKLNDVITQEAMDTLHAKYTVGEERVKVFVMKHWKNLNDKVTMALTQGWNELLA